MNNSPKYSIIIPIYNESGNIPLLYDRLDPIVKSFDGPTEVIFVNDGSEDNSIELLNDLRKQDPTYKVIVFSRNFGHQTAITAGLDYSSGDAVMVMDGDLQDPPEVLPNLIAKWSEGFDVVYAIRKLRKEGFLKKVAYKSFYYILNSISEVKIPIDSGDFGLMDKKVVDRLKKMPERNRFVRGIRSWVGYRQTGLQYERESRHSGKPKYTFPKLMKLAADGFISFSNVPLRIMVYIGSFVSLIAFIGVIITLHKRLFTTNHPEGYTTILVSMLFIGGIQLLGIGLLGEYLGRIYDEVKQRPKYIIDKLIGFNRDE